MERVVGMFVNTLALRNYPSGEKSFEAFLAEVKDRTLSAYENQEYQFEELVDRLSLKRDVSRNPIFDVMFNYLNQDDYRDARIDDHKQDQTKSGEGIAKFDMTLTGVEIGERLCFDVVFCDKIFKTATIKRYIHYFKRILSELIPCTTRKISDISLLSIAEKQQLIQDFNRPGAGDPGNRTLHRIFEEQAEKVPDNVAITALSSYPGNPATHENIGDEQHITYREFQGIVSGFSHMLKEKGVQPDSIIGIMGERSIAVTAGMMGILKTGCAYLPIEPDYPEERKTFMLKDSGAGFLVVIEDSLKGGKNLQGWDGKWIRFNPSVTNKIPAESLQSSPGNRPSSERLAYVIFTSGTTGRPKGVLVEHGNAVNTVTWFSKTHHVVLGTRVLLMSDFTFDPSVNQVFGPLLHGGSLYIVSREMLFDFTKMRHYIESRGINILNFVPWMLNELLSQGPRLSSVRAVLSGGERLDESVKASILNRGYQLYNQYGPTETTIDALVEQCSEKSVSLGKPISNARCHILDKYGQMTPIGVSGELHIAGCGVSRGYLNRVEWTQETFGYRQGEECLKGERFYRTGDRARWCQDGRIEFLGRMDMQVKIRGYRVELAEIEAQLLKHENIKEAVAAVKEDDNGFQGIAAYVVDAGFPESISDPGELKDFLAHRLPIYMIPSSFIHLEKIPLSANGKVDRKALPVPETRAEEGPLDLRNDLEESIARIWSDTLNIKKESIGKHTNFFELGGNSLSAINMISKIHKKLQVKVPLVEVFKNGNISGLARLIRNTAAARFQAILPVEKRTHYKTSSAQQRLYILQQMELKNISYNIPQFIQLEGDPDKDKLEMAFKKLIERHESFRTSFEMINMEPVQRIHDQVSFEIEYYNEIQPDETRQILKKFVRPFDLEHAPLIRIGLIKTGNKQHIMMTDMHHIISDGVSMVILVKDFMDLYSNNESITLPIQYKDFSLWHARMLGGETMMKQQEYWLNKFKDKIPGLELAPHRPDKFESFEGKTIEFIMDSTISGKMNDLALKSGTTLYIVLLAAFNILLSRYSDQEDIVVGCPIFGRNHADLQHIIGMFVNLLPMRNFPKRNKPFLTFLNEVKGNALEDYENQDYQFEQMVWELNKRYPQRPQLKVNAVLVLENVTTAKKDYPSVNSFELNVSPYDRAHNISKFDLTFTALEVHDTLQCDVKYRTSLFKKQIIEQMIHHYINILEEVVEDPQVLISEIKMLSKKETKRLIQEVKGMDRKDREMNGIETIDKPGKIEFEFGF